MISKWIFISIIISVTLGPFIISEANVNPTPIKRPTTFRKNASFGEAEKSEKGPVENIDERGRRIKRVGGSGGIEVVPPPKKNLITLPFRVLKWGGKTAFNVAKKLTKRGSNKPDEGDESSIKQ